MRNGSYKWAAVGLLWIVALLNYLDRQVIFAVFPLLAKDLHLSSIALGFIGEPASIYAPQGGRDWDPYSNPLLQSSMLENQMRWGNALPPAVPEARRPHERPSRFRTAW